ncbi:MAG TPA: hypothetical protein ENI42_02560 [Thermoplasmatales archaeon]|nr:hypothetical protein [Thermoplasmatales archaeon]
MCKDGFKIVNPPWVYGPSEVKEWIDASYPTRKERRRGREKHDKPLENLRISFDFKGKKRELSNLFLRVVFKPFGLNKVEEGFDSVAVAETLLRGFARAGFRNVVEIVVDKNVVYRHPEKQYDLRQTIELFKDYKDRGCGRVELKVMFEGNCTVYTVVRKTHRLSRHAVELVFNGRIERERVRRFLNYVTKHLEVEMFADKWFRHSP